MRAVREHDPSLPLLCLPGSVLLRRAAEAGLPVAVEAFADRAYARDGTLVPRGRPGAVIHSPEEVVRRCVAIATGRPVEDADGGALHLSPDSLCLHGDTPGAVDLARRVRAALTDAGVPLAAFAPV